MRSGALNANTRSLFRVVAVLAILAAGSAWLASSLFRQPEPEHDGKKLSAWLDGFAVDSTSGVSISHSLARSSAAGAVRAVGSNAVPFLLGRIRAVDSPLEKLKGELSRRQSFIDFHYTTPRTRQIQAAYAFRALGPAAESAVPELARLLNRRETTRSAAMALGGISPKSIPHLLSALGNRDALVRAAATQGLGGGYAASLFPNDSYRPPLGTNASLAISALIASTRDSDAKVRASAIYALGSIEQDLEKITPVLIAGLNDANSDCRLMAVQALRLLGTNALFAIPALRNATADSDTNVSRFALICLVTLTNQMAAAIQR